MKFFYFYDDLIIEGRMLSAEKFTWISEKIGDWLFGELFGNPQKVQSLPFFEQFKNFLKKNTTEKIDTNSQIVMALHYLKDFLNQMEPKDSQFFIKKVSIDYPTIAQKILRFGKPEEPGKRGRPMGSKNKPKKDLYEPNILTTPKKISEPSTEIQPTQIEPKKRGRKPIESQFTAVERHIFKKEGPEKIKKLEDKVTELDADIDQMVGRIKKIMQDIDRRKSFFGIE